MTMFDADITSYIHKLPLLAKDISKKIEPLIEADLSSSLKGCDPLLKETLCYALFGGGKRIRPLLVILSSRLSGTDDEGLYELAMAFEYLHVASLVHDDLIDNAKKRRGKPSLAAQYGNIAALLAGDWMLSRCMQIISRHTGNDGMSRFCKATEGMVDGEFLQMRHAGKSQLSEEEYYSIIARKTGNLIASTCEIGGLYGGADEAKQAALRQYGDFIGTAFQIVDDLLDYQGDSTATGKQTGNDFVEGKITLPLILAMKAAEPADQELFRQLLAGDRTCQKSLQQLKDLIIHYDGFSAARQTARSYIEKAVNALSCFAASDDHESLTMLQALALYILERKK